MRISAINIYPIKSLKGISLDSAVVEERGLQYDRRWMLTTPDGMFFTQREFPRMATITTEVTGYGLRAGIRMRCTYHSSRIQASGGRLQCGRAFATGSYITAR